MNMVFSCAFCEILSTLFLQNTFGQLLLYRKFPIKHISSLVKHPRLRFMQNRAWDEMFSTKKKYSHAITSQFSKTRYKYIRCQLIGFPFETL